MSLFFMPLHCQHFPYWVVVLHNLFPATNSFSWPLRYFSTSKHPMFWSTVPSVSKVQIKHFFCKLPGLIIKEIMFLSVTELERTTVFMLLSSHLPFLGTTPEKLTKEESCRFLYRCLWQIYGFLKPTSKACCSFSLSFKHRHFNQRLCQANLPYVFKEDQMVGLVECSCNRSLLSYNFLFAQQPFLKATYFQQILWKGFLV